MSRQNKKNLSLRQTPTAFEERSRYTVLRQKGGLVMKETNDPHADLDDLIFDENDGGPSER